MSLDITRPLGFWLWAGAFYASLIYLVPVLLVIANL